MNDSDLLRDRLIEDAILRVGEVVAVHGRKVTVQVDKEKNLSDLLFDGKVIKNIAVDSYIEIRKGFLSLIGKVEGEEIKEELTRYKEDYSERGNLIKRLLTVSLVGYIDSDNKFQGGTRELPLIGNEAFVVTAEKIKIIHDLADEGDLKITIAQTDENIDISFPVDGLFNGHIAIFGNTGSGKSNTLACLYQEFVQALSGRNPCVYKNSTRFLLFDFNGEYEEECILDDKKIFRLSTRHSNGDKIPLKESDLLDLESLSILSDATEKTQKPFLKRTLQLNEKIKKYCATSCIRGILKSQIKNILNMSEKIPAHRLLDYMKEILPLEDDQHENLLGNIEWHNKSNCFLLKRNGKYDPLPSEYIESTNIFRHITNFNHSEDLLSYLIELLYIKLIDDVLANRAQNDHIAPVINRIKSRKGDINKVFDTKCANNNLWNCNNFIVINLDDVNLEMKKTIPLLLCKNIYSEHKQAGGKKSLNIIIDEAHMILSRESFREAESWKDYRLETFEEIIKEGRKFGVFVTISSQRPHDISPTITSQAHNYFIHRLINHRDLKAVANAVSYIDKLSQESIPTLPTGTCIFSGVASKRPLKVQIKELPDRQKPKSQTLSFAELLKAT